MKEHKKQISWGGDKIKHQKYEIVGNICKKDSTKIDLVEQSLKLKSYETVDEFIDWIDKTDIKDVEKLLKRYGFEFRENDEK